MSDKNSAWIVIGRFGRSHGIKGQITVHSFTEPRDNLLKYSDLHAYIGKHWLPIKIKQLELTGKHIIATIEGYTDRDQVAKLTNIDIGIVRDQLPKLSQGEYYWHELIGMLVVNTQGDELGVVDEIMPTGSNDVLVIAGAKRYLIPYLLDQFVLNIDREQRRILVDWDIEF